MKTNNIKTHWAADIFALNESDIDALAEDIKKNGQVVPIKALKDGSIVDGRNRFLACQKAGVEPVIEIINADGEELTDEQICAVVVSCNSMRRDETASRRACAAAEMWKRLHPGETRGRPEKNTPRTGGNYVEFAKDKFKAAKHPAEQALAILNHSPDLMEAAKVSLQDAYATYQKRIDAEKEEKRMLKVLNEEKNSDMKERVDAGGLSLREAYDLILKRDAEERQRKDESERRITSTISTLKTISLLAKFDHEEIQEAYTRISDDNFAEGYASGISILAQLQ